MMLSIYLSRPKIGRARKHVGGGIKRRERVVMVGRDSKSDRDEVEGKSGSETDS